MEPLTTNSTNPSPSIHLPLPFLALLAIAWIVPGLFGHEPWKPDEGYTIGLINHFATTGDWVVPTLTGDPFMEKPPIFFITAGLLGRLLSPWAMPLHYAAGLAAALYMALTLAFSFLAGREAWGQKAGTNTVLLLIGCIGLVVRGHSAITDQALWCGIAMGLYGLILVDRRLLAGAFFLGTGAGIAFMAKGLQGPGFLALTVLLLPLLCPARRSVGFGVFLAAAFLFSLPWVIIWPLALYLRDPNLFHQWFIVNNLGRFLGPQFGFNRLATNGWWGYYLVLLPWFALPLWPAALAGVARMDRARLKNAALATPLLLFLIGFFLLTIADTARELYIIPFLVPLALVAAAGIPALPVRIGAILRTTAQVAGIVGLAGLWLGWLVMTAGFPAFLERRIAAFAPGYPPVPFWAVALSLLYAAGWVWLAFRHATFRKDWVLVWAAGVTAVWGTAMLLFLPLFDHVKGYHSTFAAMREKLPEDGTFSLESRRLGESQRAILEYYFGLRTRLLDPLFQEELTPSAEYLLVQGHIREEKYEPGSGWEEIWRGTRPGDRRETYILYKKR